MISSSFPPIPPKECATIYEPHDFIFVALFFYILSMAAYTSHAVFLRRCQNHYKVHWMLFVWLEGRRSAGGSAENHCELNNYWVP